MDSPNAKDFEPNGPAEPFRAIVMHGFTSEEALAIMKAIKALGPAMQQAAFAMTTETNMHWPLGRLLSELAEEHRMMQRYKAGKEKPDLPPQKS